MTIYLPEVRKISMDYINMPVFNPNVFSEDEDDLPGKEELEGAGWVLDGGQVDCVMVLSGKHRKQNCLV